MGEELLTCWRCSPPNGPGLATATGNGTACLRRRTQKGAPVGDALGQVIAAEAATAGDLDAFDRFAATNTGLAIRN